MNKNLLRIEFDKVLRKLSDEATSEDAKKKIMGIRPMNDINLVRHLLEETYDAYTLCIRLGVPPFSGIVSVEKSVDRAVAGSVLSCSEFLDLLLSLRAMRKIKEWRNLFRDVSVSIDDKFENITIKKSLEEKIEKSIVSPEEVSDNASDELYNIRKKIRSLNYKIRKRMEEMVRSSSYKKYLMDHIVTMRSGRFVIPVKAEYKNEIKGLIHDTSSSGSTLFIEPIWAVEDNNCINELKNKEKYEIEKVLIKLTKEIADFADQIRISYNQMVNLDIIFAKAFLAFKMKASVPQINNKGVINLRKARHPLIPDESVQPIDLELGKSFDSLVITGPNTGGKTVSIKTIGLVCCMAMSGLMIPADEGSEVSVFDNILTDIGDEQSIEQSISTFSSHMKNIISILSKADDKVLVLIDEIGAGTDPEEGAALAISILEELRKKKSKIAITTHYKELKEYSVSTEGVQCAGCEFNIDTMKPTYKLLIGSIVSSNAFKIAEKLGIDSQIIKNAENILGEEKKRLNEFLVGIEKMRHDLDEKKNSIEKLYIEAEEVKKEVIKEKQRIQNEHDQILNQARLKAQDIFNHVKIKSQNIIDELKGIKDKNSFSPESRREIKSKLSNIENIVDPINEDNNILKDYDFKEGDSVMILGINKEGIISSKEDSAGNFCVTVGTVKTKVQRSKLRHLSKKVKSKKLCKSFMFKRDLNKEFNMELDLRGKSVNEAIPELEMFLDTSFMSKITHVTIIHGKGSGILRREVHNNLKGNKHVKNFRLGNFGEGEDGVTIVTIK